MNARGIRIVTIRYVTVSDLSDEARTRSEVAQKFVDAAMNRSIGRCFQRIQNQKEKETAHA